MLVLGVESSCDETAIAIFDANQGVIAHALYSQIDLHQKYGGVVPEIASRDHIKKLIPLVEQAFIEAGISKNKLDAIAYTSGPGLVGALLTGACFAKSLAYALDISAIAIHHLEAHILVAMLENSQLDFPFLALLVSGGHTQLIAVEGLGQYQTLGETCDDAVGEAFDKTAKLLGLPYPGGPHLAQLAESYQRDENLKISPFPRPMTEKPGLHFSFSGLKTHALQTWERSNKTQSEKAAIAHAFQEAVVETLVIKCKRALELSKFKKLVIAGGVGANQALRQAMSQLMENLRGEVFFPRQAYCTDNGVMIAYAGYLNLLANKQDKDLKIDVRARWLL